MAEILTRHRQNGDYDSLISAVDPIPISSTPGLAVTMLKQDKVTLSTSASETTLDSAVALEVTNRSSAIVYLSVFGNEDGVAQVDTNTIASGVTLGGNLAVTVTKAGMTGSPATITAAALGTRQVETITCTGAPSATGNITLAVTAAGMNGGVAVDVVVALDHTADTTVTLVGDKVRAAMGLDADVAGFFTVSGAAGALILTAKTAAADDATMAVAFTDTGTTSATFGASADTTAGVAPSTDEEIAEIVKDALNADGVIGAAFTATRSGADVILTAAAAAANDATISLAVATGTATGLTSSTSVNTTEGYAAGDWDELGGQGTVQYTAPTGCRNTSAFTSLWMKASTGTPAAMVRAWKEA